MVVDQFLERFEGALYVSNFICIACLQNKTFAKCLAAFTHLLVVILQSDLLIPLKLMLIKNWNLIFLKGHPFRSTIFRDQFPDKNILQGADSIAPEDTPPLFSAHAQ